MLGAVSACMTSFQCVPATWKITPVSPRMKQGPETSPTVTWEGHSSIGTGVQVFGAWAHTLPISLQASFSSSWRLTHTWCLQLPSEPSPGVQRQVIWASPISRGTLGLKAWALAVNERTAFPIPPAAQGHPYTARLPPSQAPPRPLSTAPLVPVFLPLLLCQPPCLRPQE